MRRIHYADTRGLDPDAPLLSEVILRGQARGGGLYVPAELPLVDRSQLDALADLPYHQRVARLMAWFGHDYDPDFIGRATRDAYGDQFRNRRISPVREVGAGEYLLELWHGPSCAFKDLALQLMPALLSESAGRTDPQNGKAGDGERLIVVATSGDTGKAALEGFADRPHTRLAVLYPSAGVSELQRLQMVTQEGSNLAVFGVRGDFDTCQEIARTLFADATFREQLATRFSLGLSSANSINWGRLLPQIAYYLSASADLVRSGVLSENGWIDFCVPTGNFGNILAAWYARRLGAPIRRLICACNENNVLHDFFQTGTYRVAGRELARTPSPSMDILVACNLERLLFELTGDPEAVRGWMEELIVHGSYEVGESLRSEMAGFLVSDWVSNDECLATIRETYSETGLLLDPHTAVARRVGHRLRTSDPLLVVGTAHWAKFGPDVLRALEGIGWDDPLPENLGSGHPDMILDAVRAHAPDQEVPEPLAGLADRPVRHRELLEGTVSAVGEALIGWMSGT